MPKRDSFDGIEDPDSVSEDAPPTLDLTVNEVPDWRRLILFGCQQMLLCISGMLVLPFLVSDIACAGNRTIELRVKLISATFIASGVATLLQTTFGLRLSVLHGPAFGFVPALSVYKSLPANQCPYSRDDDVPEELWMGRIRDMEGSLMVASFCLFMLGATGLVGKVAKMVGPLVIVPLMILLEVGTVPTFIEKMSLHWISVVEFVVVVFMAVVLESYAVPLPYYSFANSKIRITRLRLFGMFPYLLSILVTWFICWVLTVTDLEPVGGEARTDKNATSEVIINSPWFQVPYPGQFGTPTVDASLLCGFFASVFGSLLENLGDYEMVAKVSQQRAPPEASVNRGIMIEGIGSFLAGSMGMGAGVTTYAENIALMHITRVVSRCTMQLAGVLLIVAGLFTKIAAVLASVPDAIVGGLLGVGMAMIMGVAMGHLRGADLRISRNVAIVGLSMLAGLALPDYAVANPPHSGNRTLDSVLLTLFSIRFLVGGVVAFFLDNALSGATRTQRGFVSAGNSSERGPNEDDGYAFPKSVNVFLSEHKFLRFIPFLPSGTNLRLPMHSKISATCN